MTGDTEVWRWNVGDVWQTFSSMFQEAGLTESAKNDIARYHHLSSALLFGGCAIEALLNSKMRFYRESEEPSEAKILKELRYTTLRTKLDDWPLIFGNEDIDSKYKSTITTFLDLRNEVTHRKRKDHSLYKELDDSHIGGFVASVQGALVSVYVGIGEAFPYWVLGWNYVGFNGDETYPCLLNNQQFRHSLNSFGFNVPAWSYGEANEWERVNMTSMSGFNSLLTNIYAKCPDIEPRSIRFPQAPRLCKKWWDRSLIEQP